ncbi:hypothetical protein [Bowmanella denitrificans]|uniref:hypothetical protein n=1 Tax=Bowmanella denitrificans TaxID=366582 RepID=UPI000C99D73D|nr:hypothetical protein [Bowmanella denitrificans]
MEWQLNIGKVFKFAAILFLVQVAVSTAVTLITGPDNLSSSGVQEYMLFMHLPVLLFSVFVFGAFASKQTEKLWLHGLVILILSESFGFVAISLLMQEVYLAPTWPFELSVLLIALIDQ